MCAARLLVLLQCAVVGLLGAREPEYTHRLEPQYGYGPGDVTQGIGYGHHLHPFYYQGASRRYYNCAIEDEWAPLSEDKPKVQKVSVPKKYTSNENKLSTKERLVKHHRHPKIVKFVRKTNFQAIQKRGDEHIFEENKKLKNDHAKLVQDINSLSENQLYYSKGKNKFTSIPSPENTYTREPTATTKDQKISSYEVHEDVVDPPTFAPRRPTTTLPLSVYRDTAIISSVRPSYLVGSLPHVAPTKTPFNTLAVEVNRGVYPQPLVLAGGYLPTVRNSPYLPPGQSPPYILRGALVPVTYHKVKKFAHRPPRLTLLDKLIKFIPSFL